MTAFVYSIDQGTFERASGVFNYVNWPLLSGTGGRVAFGAVPSNCTLKFGDCWSIYYYSTTSKKITAVVVIA